VYKITPSGVGTVLYNFTGGTDGAFPNSGVIRDSAGNLYGTAIAGGTTGCGVIFKLDTAGTQTLLYTFQCGDDGQAPGDLIRDSAGNFYGTTQGGVFSGTVFKLDTSGVKTTLHSFTGPPDGMGPVGALIRDSAGNLYGATQDGGTGQCGSIGCGIVYKLDSTGNETVLYSFAGFPDGATPLGGVIRDSAGNLYGTTTLGGPNRNGTVFKIDTAGTETVLYGFAGGTDGSIPDAGLVMDNAGNLYGSTTEGGIGEGGIVFRVEPAGTENILHTFKGTPDGASPNGGLTIDAAGNLYGVTFSGGAHGGGMVFEIKR
jgi:uncharacterized repeat protein (TIGR03803 family)